MEVSYEKLKMELTLMLRKKLGSFFILGISLTLRSLWYQKASSPYTLQQPLTGALPGLMKARSSHC